MTRGVNRTIVSGDVSGHINYSTKNGGDPVLTFSMASDRRDMGGVVTVWVKINVYIAPLIQICRPRLKKGTHVLVDGELMNRDGQHGKLTEVRAREIIFFPRGGHND